MSDSVSDPEIVKIRGRGRSGSRPAARMFMLPLGRLFALNRVPLIWGFLVGGVGVCMASISVIIQPMLAEEG